MNIQLERLSVNYKQCICFVLQKETENDELETHMWEGTGWEA